MIYFQYNKEHLATSQVLALPLLDLTQIIQFIFVSLTMNRLKESNMSFENNSCPPYIISIMGVSYFNVPTKHNQTRRKLEINQDASPEIRQRLCQRR
jgi:hypothetical protein